MTRRITIKEERITLGTDITKSAEGDRVFIFFWEQDINIDCIVDNPKKRTVIIPSTANSIHCIVQRKRKNYIVHST